VGKSYPIILRSKLPETKLKRVREIVESLNLKK
jgi:hypothetical protein